MKYTPHILLGGAALVLGSIALRSSGPKERPAMTRAADGSLQVPLAILGDVPAGQIVREFAVDGMCCKGCTRKLYDALLALPEVERAAVHFESARAFALVPSSLDSARLIQALSFDKYTAKALP